MQAVFERTLQTVVQRGPPTGGPSQVNREERNLYLNVIKLKMRALDTKAPDMTQELESFFLPIDSYIKSAGAALAPATELEEARVSLLHNTLGDAARHAMKGTPATDMATYALYKAAITKRFLTDCDPCHLNQLLRAATMGPSETTKEFVTRLWAIVSRIPDLTLDLQQREILTSLRMGHNNLQLRNLLMEKQPKTVPDAERICEEFEARERMAPVSTKFAAAMASANPAVPVDDVQQGGGYRGPKNKNRGGGRGNNSRGGGGRRGNGNQQSGNLVCHRCQKNGHIAKYCLATAPAVPPPSRSSQPSTSNPRNPARPILNVATAPVYSDYAATQEHRQNTAWPPHYLPQFQDAGEASAAAYDGYQFAQDEVITGQDALQRVTDNVGLSYGYGYPHRRSWHDINETSTVSPPVHEWCVPVNFPRCDYICKVDTGARVNVISLSDLSRLGYTRSDLQPSQVCLVGFNKSVVRPVGTLRVRIRVNGVSFVTEFQVVDRCNSPLLCLADAARAQLVNMAATACMAPISESASTPGCYRHEVVSLTLTPDAKPKQFPPRKVPLALQKQTREQLDEMLRDGVIERVTEPSPWCHPMQIAHKPDGRLRICMDPRYLNQYLERAIFPFPSLDQVFSSVRGSKFFSKIDLTWGFWNLQLDEASSKLCTFSTPWGVYRYRRLPFGVSPAPEVFHRVLADVLRDIPGVIHYVDDVLVFGVTQKEHDARLRVVLRRLREAGFALSEAKCHFSKPAVLFLGHLISGTAIKPDPDKISALQAMRPPTNISEHRGLMGFVNFLAQYLPHFSALTEPLRRLQSGKAHFKWTEDQQQAFDLIKRLFAEDPCLAPFDVYAPLSLATDASATGLGAVLLQHGRPVLYAARSLTDAEKRYSTIEKELLAVVFALRRCHFYTYGRVVRILTDHKSLLGLVGADLDQLTPRLRRFVERLFPYHLTWEHIPGKENVIPDYLSRMSPASPTRQEVAEALTMDTADTRFTHLLLGGGDFYQRMASSSFDDPLFKFLRASAAKGWQRKPPLHVPGAGRYWPLRDRLRVAGPFLVLDDDRVCVPAALVPEALQLLHLGHPGTTGMCAKARQVLYWPGWTKDIRTHVQACIPCSETAAADRKPPFFLDAPPEHPGDHVAADHFQFRTECYLVLLDLFSGFPFLHKCATPTTASALAAVKSVFLQTGLPRVFLSDGGSAFVSQEFQTFLRECNVQHRVSTPQYAQSNGAAERAVRTFKTLRAKCTTPFELFQAVLELQNTTRAPGSVSPSEVFFGRTQRTWSQPRPRATHVSWPHRFEQLCAGQRKMVTGARRDPTCSSALLPGSTAILRDFFGTSVPVTVLGFGDAPRSYRIRLPTGRDTVRNRAFLFPVPRHHCPSAATSRRTTTTPSNSPLRPRPSPPWPAPIPTPTTRSCLPRVGSTEERLAGTAFTSRSTSVTHTATPTSSYTPPTAVLVPSVSSSPNTLPGVTSTLVTPAPAHHRPPVTTPSPSPSPGSPANRNANVVAGKRRVQLTWRAREATPRSYRPHQLYLQRLSPGSAPPRLSTQTAAPPPLPLRLVPTPGSFQETSPPPRQLPRDQSPAPTLAAPPTAMPSLTASPSP